MVQKTTDKGHSKASRMTNFEVGKQGRRLRSIPTTVEAINAQIRKYGRNALARSRYLCTNNAYASSAKEAFVAALVGDGIKPSSLVEDKEVKKEIQTLWYDWSDEADADGRTDIYGLQALIGYELYEAGEVFVRFRERRTSDGLSVGLQLQILPAEMLPLHTWQISGNRRIECGIEFDRIGRRRAYHFLRNHPGEMLRFAPSSSDTVEVPASEVLHIYRPIKAGQIRGIPYALSGMTTLALLDLYDDAELERKRTTALFAGFIRNKSEIFEGDDIDSDSEAVNAFESLLFKDINGIEPGALIDLDDGEEITFSSPTDVGGNYESFEYRNLLKAAAGLGVPYSDMTGDLRQVNYASQRSGLVQFRRRIGMLQHHTMVFNFCRPVWLRWFQKAVEERALSGITVSAYNSSPRDHHRVKHIPPKWEWIDPLKDRQAEKVAVDEGWKARSDVIEAEGFDPEEVDMRRKQDMERAEDAGLTNGSGAASENLPPSSEPEDDPDDPDNPANNPEPEEAPND